MNSTTSGNNLYTYHIITNTEFTGVIDKYKVHGYLHNTEYCSNIYDYHLFIKYGDKVYMDVKGVGDIVISFNELQKNKYWKHYYDLSLMLTNNKHLIIQDLEYNSNYIDPYIYKEKRFWSINTAYIDGSYDAKTKNVVDNEYNCYYKINPHDLENMKYSSSQKLNNFKIIYMSRYEIRAKIFDKKSSYYYNFVLDYFLSYMEKEVDELSTIFEDKKNLINLAVLNDKEDINSDIIMIIYNNLVNNDRKLKYDHLITQLEKSKRLESIAQIIAA
jgi:hypothetical protein